VLTNVPEASSELGEQLAAELKAYADRGAATFTLIAAAMPFGGREDTLSELFRAMSRLRDAGLTSRNRHRSQLTGRWVRCRFSAGEARGGSRSRASLGSRSRASLSASAPNKHLARSFTTRPRSLAASPRGASIDTS